MSFPFIPPLNKSSKSLIAPVVGRVAPSLSTLLKGLDLLEQGQPQKEPKSGPGPYNVAKTSRKWGLRAMNDVTAFGESRKLARCSPYRTSQVRLEVPTAVRCVMLLHMSHM